MISYEDAGVSIEKGDQLVARIKEKVKKTYGQNVVSGVGGFAALYKISKEKYLATGTDGVGTKIKLAIEMGIHNTIGIDLVAMCVNDIICTGAKPLFFLDYLATGKLDVEISSQIIDGIVEGCLQSEMALIGGETAEMPGMYNEGEYDLAGFAVGEVSQERIIDGRYVCEGDRIIGINSSGPHSNGFSLIRKLIRNDETDLCHQALTPTAIYVKLIHALLEKIPDHIKGIAHITGGGFTNIARINSRFDYKIDNYLNLPHKKFFNILKDRSNLSDAEMFKTFNMGIGLVLITNHPQSVLKVASEYDFTAIDLGSVYKGEGKIDFNGLKL